MAAALFWVEDYAKKDRQLLRHEITLPHKEKRQTYPLKGGDGASAWRYLAMTLSRQLLLSSISSCINSSPSLHFKSFIKTKPSPLHMGDKSQLSACDKSDAARA